MSGTRWRLILNGKSADDERVREAVASLRGRGVDLGVRVTWESGDAARYVDEACADGVETVVAAGGDHFPGLGRRAASKGRRAAVQTAPLALRRR